MRRALLTIFVTLIYFVRFTAAKLAANPQTGFWRGFADRIFLNSYAPIFSKKTMKILRFGKCEKTFENGKNAY